MIIRKNESAMDFEDLDAGIVFERNGTIYLKMEEFNDVEGNPVNAVELDSGNTDYISCRCLVIPYPNAFLTLND